MYLPLRFVRLLVFKERGINTLLICLCVCRYVCGAKGLVTMEKEWTPNPISYPHQLTVKVILFTSFAGTSSRTKKYLIYHSSCIERVMILFLYLFLRNLLHC